LIEGFLNEAMNNGASVGYKSELWQTGVAVGTNVDAVEHKNDWQQFLEETVL
jgi:hypothetical protein